MNKDPITLVVSIDGVAPRHINSLTMPTLTQLARQGASCFNAQTIKPSLTLPAHTSMLRGVDAKIHGIISNTPAEPKTQAPTFLAQARRAGLKTACFTNWQPFECMFESDAIEEKFYINGGYDAEEDDRILVAASEVLNRRSHPVVFVYFAQTDIAGHDHGWDSAEYVSAITKADSLLGELIAPLTSRDSIIVTTDHGGLGNHHEQSRPEDMRTFLVAKSPQLLPASFWNQASILDVPPLVAHLAEFEPHHDWQNQSIVGKEGAILDHLMHLLAGMADHSYGERVNMLEHSLQAAALCAENGGDDSLILACLLHDLGHLNEVSGGQAGKWGLPGHAEVGAHYCQQFFNPCVTEPIRLHVLAKRYLISTDDDYLSQLSEASIQTLEQQGGRLSAVEISAFAQEPFAQQAIQLRKYDDSGKVDDLQIADLNHYQELIRRALVSKPVDPTWARDACTCPECRDPANGQHLINASHLTGWSIIGESYLNEPRSIRLLQDNGEQHICILDDRRSCESTKQNLKAKLWGSSFADELKQCATKADDDLSPVFQQLVNNGIALITDLPAKEGEVLRFAEQVGFVRETNYGRSFDVVAEPDPINLAYSPVGLPLHTDNPYRDPCPGIQLLHCIQNSKEGGQSLLADGFKAAYQLKEHHPDYFRVLSQQLVEFRFASDDTHLSTRKPIIELNNEGELTAIRINNRSMQAPKLNAQRHKQFYAAYNKLCDLVEENAIEIRLDAGELIAFDNSRVLHGRKGYKISDRRHLQGCYIDMDAVRSSAALSQL